MDFVSMLCRFAEFGEEFGVLSAQSVRLLNREELAVKHVAGLIERLLSLVAPLRFLSK